MKEWLPAGTTIGRYRISSRISAEGLGEVYLATDLSSGMEAALKLLPAAITNPQNIRQRYLKIFAAISKLRHKNLAGIYEFGIAENDRPFIAMEYVKGQSLDLLSYGHQLTVNEIAGVIIQLADVLEACHSRGWLHLAIKPSNVMLNSERQAKILDLGLGLAFPLQAHVDDSDPLKLTPGSARYMSPEQLKGYAPDQRTDIFSLGAVFYELIAGHPPFVGSTVNEVTTEIVSGEPLPLIEFVEGMSPELNRIVMKALARNLDERYQTAAQMSDDLRRLNSKQSRWSKWATSAAESFQQGENAESEIKAAAELRRSAKRSGSPSDKPSRGSLIDDLRRGLRNFFDGLRGKGGPVEKLDFVRERSNLEDLAIFVRSYWRRILIAGLAFLALILAVLIIGNFRHSEPGEFERGASSVSLLTGNGKTLDAAISPYGDKIVYAMHRGPGWRLLTTNIKDNSETPLADSDKMFRGLTYSPDASRIVYVKAGVNERFGSLFQINSAGGSEEDLRITNVLGAPSFSPDGKQLAVAAANETGSETWINVCDLNGACRKLAAKKSPEFFDSGGVAWSPDGNFITCVVKDPEGGLYLKLAMVSVVDGSESVIASGRWSEIDRAAWLQNGSGLLVAAAEPNSRSTQLWRLSYPSGEINKLSPDARSYRGISVTERGDKILSVAIDTWSNIRIASNVEPSRAEILTDGVADGSNGLDWTPGNQIVYSSRVGGRETIWISSLNGKDRRPLSVAPEGGEGGEYQPAISADGKYIVYVVDRSSGAYLWRSELDRRNLKRLTDENLVFYPAISLDGRNVFYSVLREGRRVLAKSSIDGGAPVSIVEKQTWRSSVSPDGKKIVSNYWDDSNAMWKIAVFSIDGGQLHSSFNAPGNFHRVVRWMPDSSGVVYPATTDGVSNLWVQKLDGSAPYQLTTFMAERIFDFAWSRDGQRIAYAQGSATSDVIMIQNSK